MPLYLGHTTAIQLLDALPTEQLTYASESSLRHCAASKKALSELDLSLLANARQPFDVLISSPNELRRWPKVRCHKCPSELPTHSFIEIARDVYLASPELSFVLYAQNHTLAQTIVLGSRYCGTFALDASSPTGTRERKPIATPDGLRTYARSCYRLAGGKKAQRAAELIIPGSASPMESACSLVFYLSTRLGGYGFKDPCLNYVCPLDEKEQLMTGKSFLRFDVYWPDYDFGLEYQGKQSHSESQNIADDIARQLAAEHHGKTLQMVTKQQFTNTEQRLFLAQKVAQHIGEHVPAGKTFLERNETLIKELFV